jgi:hypothetical protein
MGSTYELRIVKSQRSTLTGTDLVADLPMQKSADNDAMKALQRGFA